MSQCDIKIQGVSGTHFKISRKCSLELFNKLHDVYVHELGINFDGLFGLDILNNLNAKIDFKNKKLILPEKDVPLYTEKTYLESLKVQSIKISPRTEQIISLRTNSVISEGICPATVISKNVRIPAALVKNNKGIFVTTIINCSEIEENVNINPIDLEEIDYSNDHVVNAISTGTGVSDATSRADKILNGLRLSHLNTEERTMLQDLCLDFQDIFYFDGDILSFTNEIKHCIDTGSAKPIFTKSYRYPHIHKEEIKNQITKLLHQNIIRKSVSPWSSPVWVVPKKLDASGEQKWRMVVDYRKLNEVTVPDKYPLPNITDLLDQLGKCSYFSLIDLATGFFQIEMNEADIPKTAFSVDNGLYEFLRMPQGCRTAPSTFQRVMDNVLRGLQNEKCLVYMDDILVYSATLEEHVNRLREVFERLRKYNLKIQPDKCEFLRKEICYLGHVVTPDGVLPNPDKISAIQNYPIPQNEKDIRAFLGLTGYYRRFIPNYAKIVKPLTKLLKKDTVFCFDPPCLESFQLCKDILTSPPILQYPNFEQEFILTTDASAFAIGSVLSQGEIGKDLPIAYASRTLNGAETRYSVIEKELLSIIWSVKHFRPYLYGRKFKLVTDQKPLQYLFSIKDPGSSRLARWRLSLEDMDYEIVYKPGKLNKNADALSRIRLDNQTISLNLATPTPIDINEINETPLLYDKIRYINSKPFDKNFKHSPFMLFMPRNINEEEIPYFNEIVNYTKDKDANFKYLAKHKDPRNHQEYIIIKDRQDYHAKTNVECLYNIFVDLEENVPLEYLNTLENIYVPLEYDHFTFNSEVFAKVFHKVFPQTTLCFCREPIIPEKEEIPNILEKYHDSRYSIHKGISETMRRIKEKYYWKTLNADVSNYVQSCPICNKGKTMRQNLDSPLVITETPDKPFVRVNIDLLEVPQGIILLTLLDEFSKFAQAYVLEDKTSKSVIKGLLTYFQHFGIPKRLHMDQGLEFKNKNMQELSKLYEFDISYSAVSHPQSNGSVERFHATLLDSLRCFKLEYPHKSVVEIIPYALISYNNSKHSSTLFPPQELLFFYTNSKPLDFKVKQRNYGDYINEMHEKSKFFYRQVKNNIIEQKNKAKERFDKHIKNRNVDFNVGDLVWLRDTQIKNKLKPKYLGPYKIITLPSKNSATLELDNGKLSTVNFDRLRPHVNRNPEF